MTAVPRIWRAGDHLCARPWSRSMRASSARAGPSWSRCRPAARVSRSAANAGELALAPPPPASRPGSSSRSISVRDWSRGRLELLAADSDGARSSAPDVDAPGSVCARDRRLRLAHSRELLRRGSCWRSRLVAHVASPRDRDVRAYLFARIARSARVPGRARTGSRARHPHAPLPRLQPRGRAPHAAAPSRLRARPRRGGAPTWCAPHGGRADADPLDHDRPHQRGRGAYPRRRRARHRASGGNAVLRVAMSTATGGPRSSGVPSSASFRRSHLTLRSVGAAARVLALTRGAERRSRPGRQRLVPVRPRAFARVGLLPFTEAIGTATVASTFAGRWRGLLRFRLGARPAGPCFGGSSRRWRYRCRHLVRPTSRRRRQDSLPGSARRDGRLAGAATGRAAGTSPTLRAAP